MRTVLLGIDLLYNANGDLIPIEMNTNVGMSTFNVIEDPNEIFNRSAIENFISQHNFTKVSYIGFIESVNKMLNEICQSNNLEYKYHKIMAGVVIPILEDAEDHLIVRSAYDYSAIVDYYYCRNKVNFLNLIKDQSFGTEFAYLDENNQLINYITTIPDYGNHPNFILKSVLPNYDKAVYPKLFRVTNQNELDIVIQNNVNQNYFLMTFHLNTNMLYENHIKVVRSMSLMFPPNLDNIPIGQYSKISGRNLSESTFDTTTFEVIADDKNKYLTDDTNIGPKLLDTDRVEMSDGTFKTALDLQVGDLLKTIIIPNPNNIDIAQFVYSYEIDFETLVSGTTYSQNVMTGKGKIDKLTDYVTITFTDDTIWEDTKNSSYLILRNDIVYFRYLDKEDPYGIREGDQIILIDTSNNSVNFVLKEIKTVVITKQIFSGWAISVAEEHLFLTQNDGNVSYVAIEHNADCYAAVECMQGGCIKGEICCQPEPGVYECYPTDLCMGCHPT